MELLFDLPERVAANINEFGSLWNTGDDLRREHMNISFWQQKQFNANPSF